VVKLTGLLREYAQGDQLANWYAGDLPPGPPQRRAQLSLFERADGWRYQLIATNTPTGQPVFLEARHRTSRPRRNGLFTDVQANRKLARHDGRQRRNRDLPT
jgi:hypothetical protein